MGHTVGSILHGAYGDYYEQLVCLKKYKRENPRDRLVLFFASDERRKELAVFDLAFADELHGVDRLGEVHVDRFHQYQVRDEDLVAEVIAARRSYLATRMDLTHHRKPWTELRDLDVGDRENDVGLSDLGRERLPRCMEENGVDAAALEKELTVGFLWRYRAEGPGAAVSSFGKAKEEDVRRTKSDLLRALVEDYGARVLVCGMNVRVTEENRARVDAKFTDRKLDVDSDRVVYLKGLSWGLELEILQRCRFCIVMPSGFSEALWLKQRVPLCLVDSPPHYLAKIVWNRMPLFGLRSPRELLFQARTPHSKARVLRELHRRGLLPGDAPDRAQ